MASKCTLTTFRLKLSEIAAKLDEEKFTKLKFLCADCIPDGDREKIRTPEELFLELKQRTVVAPNHLEFLIQCLENVGRNDLADDLKNYERKVAEVSTCFALDTKKLNPWRATQLSFAKWPKAIQHQEQEAATAIEKDVELAQVKSKE